MAAALSWASQIASAAGDSVRSSLSPGAEHTSLALYDIDERRLDPRDSLGDQTRTHTCCSGCDSILAAADRRRQDDERET